MKSHHPRLPQLQREKCARGWPRPLSTLTIWVYTSPSPGTKHMTVPLKQKSLTSGLRTNTSSWSIRNRTAQQEVSGGRVHEASSVLIAAYHHLSCASGHQTLDSHRSTDPWHQRFGDSCSEAALAAVLLGSTSIWPKAAKKLSQLLGAC